ncbi:MAG: sigma-70 domain-containing protein [Faecalimonas sp.]|nr:sigma-70 domain-containing protein [Faecalimonas sp.]
MEAKAEFLKKLNGLVAMAKGQGDQITIDEVKAYFADAALTEEQLELVFDYLLAQKVVVKGYIKMTEATEEKVTYTEEEEAYLKEYLNDLGAFQEEKAGEKESLFAKIIGGDASAKNRLTELYLKEVVEIAKEMYHPEIFLGDMIQEGNVGLILGLDMLVDVATAHETIVNQVKQCIQMLIEEHAEVKSRDNKMVEKVTMLDESIKALTEELGRKVTIDELAVYMGMTEEEIDDILRLMGEESEDEEENE